MHIFRATSALRNQRTLFSHQLMKFRSSTVGAAAAVLSSGFLPFQSQAWTPSHPSMLGQRQFSSALKPTSMISLQASVMAESEAELVAFPNAPKVVAEGSVVSFFRGGLAAIRIEEEYFDGVATTTPEVVSPTEMPAIKNTIKKQSTDSGGDLVGHEVVFPSGTKGVVVAHRPPLVFAYGGMDTFEAQDGAVEVLNRMAPVPLWDSMKIVGWDGNPLEQETSDKIRRERAMFHPIPQVKDIALINHPVLTGTTMVDVLAPIGRGQNMLLISDDMAEARGMIGDFISTQLHRVGNEQTKFVYAAIDDRSRVMANLEKAGVAEKVHVVQPLKRGEGDKETDIDDASKAAEATAIAATACAIAEAYAVGEGKNAVVIIDTLDQHKKLWDATTRVLVDVFGVDAVVKGDREGGASSEMRAFYSSIIQRSAQYKEKRGGGSVTLLLLSTIPKLQNAGEDTVYTESDFEQTGEKVRERIQFLVKKGIPLTASNLRKINIPVPSASEGQRRLVLQYIDDLISMSDGQIWLDEGLRDVKQYPSLDPQKSVTRIGIGADTQSRADAPAIRRVAEGLRLELSQSASMDGADNTSASQKQIRRRKALLLAMHQEAGEGGRKLSESCTVLLAASKGFLDDAIDDGKLAGTDAGEALIEDMLSSVWAAVPEAMGQIDETLDIEDDTQKEIVDALEAFFSL